MDHVSKQRPRGRAKLTCNKDPYVMETGVCACQHARARLGLVMGAWQRGVCVVLVYKNRYRL